MVIWFGGVSWKDYESVCKIRAGLINEVSKLNLQILEYEIKNSPDKSVSEVPKTIPGDNSDTTMPRMSFHYGEADCKNCKEAVEKRNKKRTKRKQTQKRS